MAAFSLPLPRAHAAAAPAPLSRLDRAAYRVQQTTFLLHALGLQRLATATLHRGARPAPDPDALATVRARYEALLEADLAHVEAGDYPRELLFQLPVADYVRRLPELVRDVPKSASRARRGDFRDLPEGVDRARFPAYFRRTFHWQTDGYLSPRSARLYDVGVELLFMGTADIMRRQLIPHITRFVRAEGVSAPRILDVACGTGRFLKQLSVALPGARLSGLDLSPAYVDAARALLAPVGEVALVADDAAQMPWRDGLFDVLTSVYLFHELPRAVRRTVLREMFRVVRPGGLVAIEDSAQPVESPELEPVLSRFPVDFHEPFYADYLRDDLAEALRETGFEVRATERAFLSKLVVAQRPA
jgi:ubiquinone/menaquinone biosynthesis C-methylase UbiE